MSQNQNADPARDISSTFAKGLQVFEAFDGGVRHRTMPEIVEATGLDRASVRRLVLTLEHLGYLTRFGRSFALSPKVLTLAGSYLQSNRIGAVVQPVLNRFSAQLGAAISVAVPGQMQAVYVAQSSLPNSTVSFGFTVGSTLPLLHTAIGRMLLASAERVWANAALATAPIVAHTPNSLPNRDAIADAVRDASTRGYALVSDEFEPGVAAIAVPIGRIGSARAVLGMSLPVEDLDPEDAGKTRVAILQRCATELLHTGGFAP